MCQALFKHKFLPQSKPVVKTLKSIIFRDNSISSLNAFKLKVSQDLSSDENMFLLNEIQMSYHVKEFYIQLECLYRKRDFTIRFSIESRGIANACDDTKG